MSTASRDSALAYHGNIEQETQDNNAFRRVLWTAPEGRMQLAVMCVTPEDGEIDREVHPANTQLLRIEEGYGNAMLGPTDKERLEPLFPGAILIIPAGVMHRIVNDTERPLRLYSVYSPAHHPPGTVHQRRVDALRAEKAADDLARTNEKGRRYVRGASDTA